MNGVDVGVDVAAVLRATCLFSDLGPADLHDLAGAAELVDVLAGETLVKPGHPSEILYVVVSGRLHVARVDEDKVTAEVSEARHGEYVGDVALEEDTTHNATVSALTDSRLLALSHEALAVFSGTHPAIAGAIAQAEGRIRWATTRRLRPQPSELITSLGQFLGGFDTAAMATLEDEVEWVQLPATTLMMRQGDPGDCLWLIVSGEVAVFTTREDGSELSLEDVGPGESLGEMALLSGEPRSASGRAITDVELLRLSKRGFDRILAEHPAAVAPFTRVVIDRLNARIRARALVTELRLLPLVTQEECNEVVHTENVVLRNLRITQMYHRLSVELTLLTGHQDTNWCTYACNASKTAGYSIRREELPFYALVEALRPRLAQRFDRWRERLAATVVAERFYAALTAVSETISAGNLKVFAELGPVFAEFTRTFHNDHAFDQEKLDRHLGTLAPGATEDDGQDTLAEALAHYYAAMFEHDRKAKSELILLANVKVGLHEQIRLQPHIAAAMDAPMRVGMGGLMGTSVDRRIGRLLPRPTAHRLHEGLDHEEEVVVRWLTKLWRRRLTRNLMTLRLPYGNVRLGSDVPKLPKKQMYPDLLQDLTNEELVAFARRFDRDETSLDHSRAADWANLDDRMSFILELMRSRQKSLELFDQPFLESQRQEMALGHVPTGRL